MSDAVVAAVRSMIVEGRLAEGARVNEVRLAADLGVSRTPLREALHRLSAEGALTNAAGFGYSVRPLTLEEFEQLYDIRPILDPEALRLAGIPPVKQIKRLEELNRAVSAAQEPEAVIARDDEWHRQLLAGCPNRILTGLIDDFILRTRRYELALMRESRDVARATEDHKAILRALRAGDLKAACAALKRNLQSGRTPIVDWLKARTRKRSGGR